MHRSIALIAIVTLFCSPAAVALYDAPPDAALAAAQGEWRGTLTYRDYSTPDRLVTLPTRVFVALAAPNQIVLHYAFDDGPGKTVFSYEAMTFDLSAKQIVWTSGSDKKETSTLGLISSTQEGAAVRQLIFEQTAETKIERFTMEVGANKLSLRKDEIAADKSVTNRNQYTFSRP